MTKTCMLSKEVDGNCFLHSIFLIMNVELHWTDQIIGLGDVGPSVE